MASDEKIIPNLDRFEIVGIQQSTYCYKSKYSKDGHTSEDSFNIRVLKDTKTGVLYALTYEGALTVLVDRYGNPCTELDGIS